MNKGRGQKAEGRGQKGKSEMRRAWGSNLPFTIYYFSASNQ